MEAKYWIAQHIEDVFRNEPRNIGVLVQVGDQMAAKFIGENEANKIDGRGLKGFPHPDVYRQWVEYWRRSIAQRQFDKLVRNGSHYKVFEAGAVTEIDSDSPEEVAKFLYTSLVSGGYKEAFEQEKNLLNQPSLDQELVSVFRDLNILGSEAKHPVRNDAVIQGKKITHKPAFSQENGRLYLMETIDFTVSQKLRSRDHAGYSAYMFNDIRENKSNAEPISIVKVREEDKESEEVRNGLAILTGESTVLYWLDQQQRELFIEERRKVAFTG